MSRSRETTRRIVLCLAVAGSGIGCGSDTTPTDEQGDTQATVEPSPLDASLAHLCVKFLGRQPNVQEQPNGDIEFSYPVLGNDLGMGTEAGEIDHGRTPDDHCPNPTYTFYEDVPVDPEVVWTFFETEGYERSDTCAIYEPAAEPEIWFAYQNRLPQANGEVRFAHGGYSTSGDAVNLAPELTRVVQQEDDTWAKEVVSASDLEQVQIQLETCSDLLLVDGLRLVVNPPADTSQTRVCHVAVHDPLTNTADSAQVVVFPGLPEHVLSCASWTVSSD